MMHEPRDIPLGDYVLDDELLAKTLTPSLVVYLDKVRENISRMSAYLDGKLERWRPHVKTSKIPEVWNELVRAGVRHFKCATTKEASVLLSMIETNGVMDSDVLIAYPHVGPSLSRLAQLKDRVPSCKLSVLCEDITVFETIPENLDVFVDINSGMNRTGMPLVNDDEIIELARACAGRFRGLHYYEGHIVGGDSVASRRELAFSGYDALQGLLGACQQGDVEIPELCTSGTPSFIHALQYEGFRQQDGFTHRVSPGTIVYHDLRSLTGIEEIDFVPAAVLLSRVVSHPDTDRLTCDAGSKALSADCESTFVIGHAELITGRPSEEHLPMQVDCGRRPRRGELLYILPWHICPAVNLAEEAILMDGAECLGIVSVAARAHELAL